MGKVEVIALAQMLAGDLGEEPVMNRFYDEGILTLSDLDVTMETHIINVTAGVASYPYPTNTMRVITAFFNSRELIRTTLNALERDNRTWSAVTGTPVTWFEINEPERSLRLYPTPDATTAGWWPAIGEPLGLDYPTDALVVLTAEDEVAPPWLDLPLALSVLAEEFRRESDHRDVVLANIAARLAKTLRTVGRKP